jgi:hypothetical protein
MNERQRAPRYNQAAIRSARERGDGCDLELLCIATYICTAPVIGTGNWLQVRL